MIKKIHPYYLPPEKVYQLLLDSKVKQFPKGFWDNHEIKERAKRIVKYLFETKLKWSRSEIVNNASRDIFIENKLESLLRAYRNRTGKLIQNAYPDMFKEWEFKRIRVSKGFWNKEKGLEATRWLVEEKLKWDKKKVQERLTYKEFHKHNLAGMLVTCFKGSVFDAINTSYPQWTIKEIELKSVPQNYWTEENAKKATKWLVEEKLMWTEEEARKKLNTSHFVNNKLYPMLLKIYQGKVSKALISAYVNRDFGNEERREKMKKIDLNNKLEENING